MELRKSEECGRSMIEMLGVLAIVGILSVGGIAGFSKAMMKHKLIQQAEFFNNIFTTMDMYAEKFKRYPHITLIPIFQTMGAISPEIRTSGSDISMYAYDNFGNRFGLRTNGCYNNICSGTVFNYNMTKVNNYDICNNLMRVIQQHHERISSAMTSVIENDSEDNQTYYRNVWRGDMYCDKGKNCLYDLTVADIIVMCEECKDKKSCNFTVTWVS